MSGFIDWYIEEYDFGGGDVNEQNYRECAMFLAGILASQGDDDENNLSRCISVLRGGANLVSVIRRKKIPAPPANQP